MVHILEDFKEFLDQSPTSYHAARELSERLAVQDFQPLDEKEVWQLEKGKSYFVLRGGSLCAFSLPHKKLKKSLILGSHTDTPSLKIKPHPDIVHHNMAMLGVEVYGVPLLASWLNRDLAIAGRVVVSDEDGNLQERLVWLDEAPLIIPQLAIHLDREVNEKGLILNKQDHIIPLASLLPTNEAENKPSSYLERLLKKQIDFKSLYSYDLFLVPLESARFLGSQGELIASYHLDNLASAHACATALGLSPRSHSDTLAMGMFWDHEEIGSHTAEGAASPFLHDVLRRISAAYSLTEENFIQLKANSLFVSVDAAHGFNPNYKQKYEPQHLPLLGHGVVLKYNANQKYASTAVTAARIAKRAEEIGISCQSYVARNDLPCGSTVGPDVAEQLGIPTVDIGIPLLSMHSIREIIACHDQLDLCTLLTALLHPND